MGRICLQVVCDTLQDILIITGLQLSFAIL